MCRSAHSIERLSKSTEPSAFFLAEKTYNKDLEIPPCRLHPNFCFAKTSLNRDVKLNFLALNLTCFPLANI